jgi:outer membrane receptor for ferrienterochelin and colicins
MNWKIHASALALGAALYSSAAGAQETGDAPPPVPSEVAPTTSEPGKQVYTPADFVRFAPKTAFDMLAQVPGFTIRQADQERGLGQASENVLINGQRIANKTGGALDELRRIAAASVERIEIVDASSLGIAGLSGQVANVIVAQQKAGGGQFEWRPDIRAHFAEPNLLRGSISYTDQLGPVEYTLSVNSQSGRGAFGGPIEIRDPLGNVTENRREVFHSESWLPTFQTKFTYDGPGSSLGNLTLAYTPYWGPVSIVDVRTPIVGDPRTRTIDQELDGYYVDFNGDYAFKVGPGTLKLIGLRHFDHEPVDTVQLTEFADGSPDEGVRFLRDTRIAETVVRAEYGWKGGKNDWQVSLERAYNSLDQRGSLFVLNPAGDFEEVDFPEGTGHVVETRYEGIGTWSRSLGSNVDVQVAAGAEYSELARIDGDIPPREFIRPKGSITLGWRPNQVWDFSLKLRRRVGQISFYDFLAQPNFQQERESSGNPDLVPPQSWEAEIEAGKSLGPWGQTRLTAYFHKIEDIVDIIPIGDDGEAVGNLPSATRLGAQWRSTFQFDPIGLRGAKLDLTAGFEDTSVRDPLSGEKRAISGTRNRWIEANFRHDIPHSDWAYGIDAEHGHYARNFYLTEINRSWEGPVWLAAYVENKDVFGLTVRAGVNNLWDARHRFERTVYDGRRLRDPVLYSQSNDQLIGPIFFLQVKGTF